MVLPKTQFTSIRAKFNYIRIKFVARLFFFKINDASIISSCHGNWV